MAEHFEDRLREQAARARGGQGTTMNFEMSRGGVHRGPSYVLLTVDDTDRLADLVAAARELEKCYGDRTLEIGPLKRVRAALAALDEASGRGEVSGG